MMYTRLFSNMILLYEICIPNNFVWGFKMRSLMCISLFQVASNYHVAEKDRELLPASITRVLDYRHLPLYAFTTGQILPVLQVSYHRASPLLGKCPTN